MESIFEILKKSFAFKEEVKNNLGFKETRKKTSNDFQIGLITSTAAEFESVKNLLTNISEIKFSDYDSSIYYSGFIDAKNCKMRVIIPFPIEMGIEAAVVTTTKLLSRCNLKYVFMVGIAAGNKNITKIGDILIADKSLNYNQILDLENNENQNKKKSMHSPIIIDSYLKSQLKLFSQTNFQTNILNDIPDFTQQLGKIKCHLGLVATGSSLIRSEKK